MKTSLLLSVLLLSFLFASAQDYALRGKITGPDEQPVQAATVRLNGLNGAVVQGALTDAGGRFRLFPVTPGTYEMLIEAAGLEPKKQRVTIIDQSLHLGTLNLEPRNYSLDEVEIKGEQAQAQQMGDTTQYNAGAFKTNPDANAEDLIAKMPGIVIEEGKVQAQGEDVQQVLVDGRPFFGNDPTAALRNLPAEVIDKIQVFDQQSEQSQFTGFDDGQTTKTINIVTRLDMKNGTFGQLSGGYGTDERYRGAGSINQFEEDKRLSILAQANNINDQNFSSEDLLGVMSSSSGGRGRRGGFGGGGGRRPGGGGGGRRGGGGSGGRGGGPGGGQRGGADASEFLVPQQGGITTSQAFGLNYADNWLEKINFTASYFFNHGENTSDQLLNRDFILNADSGQVYGESSLLGSQNYNHRMNLRLDYDIDSRNSIMIRPRATWQQNDGSESTLGLTSLKGTPLNNTNSTFSSDLSAVDFSNSFLFRHRFKKRGRTISINVRTAYTDKSGSNQLYSSLNYFTPPVFFDTLNQAAVLQSQGWNLSANVMLTERLKRWGMLQLNYSVAPQNNDSEQITREFNKLTGEYAFIDTLLSNTFTNVYWAHQVGGGLMIRNPKFNAMFRVSAQVATLDNQQVFPNVGTLKQNFFNVLPMVMFRYRISQQKNLRFFYRTNTQTPSVEQLQEVVDNSDPLFLSTGNPELDQSYQHNMMIRYNATNTAKSTVFFFLLNGTYTQNYIGQSTFIPSQDTLLANSFLLQAGTQLSSPTNLGGQYQLRSFLTYGLPVKAIKSNLNINLSANYTRTPSLINEIQNETRSSTLGAGLTLSSNISKNVDFTVSTRSNVSEVQNNAFPIQDTWYINQTSFAKVNLIFWKGFVFRAQVTNQRYRGLSDEFNQDFWLFNTAVAKKIFKSQRGEIQLSVFDVLRQNNSIQRTISDTYIQDLQTQVIQQYAMLGFTWQIRNFKLGS